MNYLAHSLLAGDGDDLLLGNLIADHVKGKSALDLYPADIRYGILQHRAVDRFTDEHPIVKASIQRLGPPNRRIAPILVDIIYDYYLASEWGNFSEIPLQSHNHHVYTVLSSREQDIPERFLPMARRIVELDILGQYQRREGIDEAIRRVLMRLKMVDRFPGIVNSIGEQSESLQEDFRQFFPMLQDHARNFSNT